MNKPAQIEGDEMLKAALLAIPGGNYAVIAYTFVTTYWRPLLLAGAVIVSYHEGVKHERKIGEAAQAKARLEKVTFERDNLKSAGELAAKQIEELEKKARTNEDRVAELRKAPAAGDCALSDDAVKRLRGIGRGHERPRD